MKKVLWLVVMVIFVFSTLAGCVSSTPQTTAAQTGSTTQGSSGPEKGPYWISDTKITLKVMSDRDPIGAEWKELSIFKTLEEMTNIAFEFDVVSTGYVEKKNLALATGDLPDLFISNIANITPMEEEIYGSQGFLIPLNDLIDQNTVFLKRRMEEMPLLRKVMTASDGNIYSLARVAATATIGSYKPVINRTWLDNLGLSMPGSVDELYEVLVAFRDKDPNKTGANDTIPLSERGFGNLNGALLPSFGEMCHNNSTRLYIKDGVVQYYAMNDGYKAYLEYLNKLYKENLLDNMFLSHSNEEYLAKTSRNIIGMLGHIRQADWQQYEIMEPLTSEYNSQKWSSSTTENYVPGRFAITKENKYPVESIKFADLFAAKPEEAVNGISGQSLWIGQKGVDWDITADNTVKFLFKPDEGLTDIQHVLKYIAPSQSAGFGINVLRQPFEDGYQKWVGLNNVEYIFPYVKMDMLYPPVRLTNEENEKIGILQTDLNTYVEEMTAKFVIGEEPLSNWNNYVETIKKMGISDYISIYQAAYDRFTK